MITQHLPTCIERHPQQSTNKGIVYQAKMDIAAMLERKISALPPPSSLSQPPSPQLQQQVQPMDPASSTGSYLNAPIQSKHLPTHQRQQSNDSTCRESSASSSHAGALPHHRSKLKAACIPCRKRQSKVLLCLSLHSARPTLQPRACCLNLGFLIWHT